jgi:hypothetical protein
VRCFKWRQGDGSWIPPGAHSPGNQPEYFPEKISEKFKNIFQAKNRSEFSIPKIFTIIFYNQKIPENSGEKKPALPIPSTLS